MSDDKLDEAIEKVDDGIRRFRCYPDSGPLGGVCAGIAYRLAMPAWIVRLVWFLVFWLAGAGGLIYLALWIFVPNASTPKDYEDRTGGP